MPEAYTTELYRGSLCAPPTHPFFFLIHISHTFFLFSFELKLRLYNCTVVLMVVSNELFISHI